MGFDGLSWAEIKIRNNSKKIRKNSDRIRNSKNKNTEQFRKNTEKFQSNTEFQKYSWKNTFPSLLITSVSSSVYEFFRKNGNGQVKCEKTGGSERKNFRPFSTLARGDGAEEWPHFGAR